MLVVLEFDILLDMGFEPQIKEIFRLVRPDRQVLWWSSTWQPNVQAAVKRFTPRFLRISLEQPLRRPTQTLDPCFGFEKFDRLVAYLKGQQPSRSLVNLSGDAPPLSQTASVPESPATAALPGPNKTLIFCNKKASIDALHQQLTKAGIKSGYMYGDRTQAEREAALTEFTKGACNVFIVTDLAARGIALQDTDLLINYDMPDSIESYVYRVGRLGHVSLEQRALSFVTHRDSHLFTGLAKILEESAQSVPGWLSRPELLKLPLVSDGDSGNKSHLITRNLFRPIDPADQDAITSFRQEHSVHVTCAADPTSANLHPCLSFTQVGFSDALLKFLEQRYKKPAPIQSEAWPYILSGRDVVMVSETGSGKNLAFALPAIVHAMVQPRAKAGDGPACIILSPTREIALQTSGTLSVFEEFSNVRTVCISGGSSNRGDKSHQLDQGVEICVATPDRFVELLDENATNCSRVSLVVIDECNRLLELGYAPQVRKVILLSPSDRQTLLWSATWSEEVEALSMGVVNRPVMITIGPSLVQPETPANS
eukprot:c20324_g1_i3.p1 GENE.c20324_g1_i3~~c20324_g1_i3.p1  ORF type:complete len:540 (-),score=105.42 c20324_g1_i3:129-1748(-)